MPLTQGSRTHGEVTSRDNDVPYLVKANVITTAENSDIFFKLKKKKEMKENSCGKQGSALVFWWGRKHYVLETLAQKLVAFNSPFYVFLMQ